MMETSNQKDQFELGGRHVAMMLIGFFAIIILVNLTMAMLASSTWTGLVVRNSYVASQKFNTSLEEAKAQRELGWKSSITYENGDLGFRIEDKSGSPMALQSASLEIGRPAFEQQDRIVNIQPDGARGIFANLKLASGLWQGTLVAESGGRTYRRDFRLYVTEDGSSRLDP